MLSQSRLVCFECMLMFTMVLDWCKSFGGVLRSVSGRLRGLGILEDVDTSMVLYSVLESLLIKGLEVWKVGICKR